MTLTPTSLRELALQPHAFSRLATFSAGPSSVASAPKSERPSTGASCPQRTQRSGWSCGEDVKVAGIATELQHNRGNDPIRRFESFGTPRAPVGAKAAFDGAAGSPTGLGRDRPRGKCHKPPFAVAVSAAGGLTPRPWPADEGDEPVGSYAGRPTHVKHFTECARRIAKSESWCEGAAGQAVEKPCFHDRFVTGRKGKIPAGPPGPSTVYEITPRELGKGKKRYPYAGVGIGIGDGAAGVATSVISQRQMKGIVYATPEDSAWTGGPFTSLSHGYPVAPRSGLCSVASTCFSGSPR